MLFWADSFTSAILVLSTFFLKRIVMEVLVLAMLQPFLGFDVGLLVEFWGTNTGKRLGENIKSFIVVGNSVISIKQIISFRWEMLSLNNFHFRLGEH